MILFVSGSVIYSGVFVWEWGGLKQVCDWECRDLEGEEWVAHTEATGTRVLRKRAT